MNTALQTKTMARVPYLMRERERLALLTSIKGMWKGRGARRIGNALASIRRGRERALPQMARG